MIAKHLMVAGHILITIALSLTGCSGPQMNKLATALTPSSAPEPPPVPNVEPPTRSALFAAAPLNAKYTTRTSPGTPVEAGLAQQYGDNDAHDFVFNALNDSLNK